MRTLSTSCTCSLTILQVLCAYMKLGTTCQTFIYFWYLRPLFNSCFWAVTPAFCRLLYTNEFKVILLSFYVVKYPQCAMLTDITDIRMTGAETTLFRLFQQTSSRHTVNTVYLNHSAS